MASLSRPGGNVTGITIFGGVAVTKRMQLMHELVPQAPAIAYLMNPNNPNSDAEMRTAQEAARSLGKEILVLSASNELERSTQRSQLWLNSKSTLSSSALTCSFTPNATGSSRWQHAIEWR